MASHENHQVIEHDRFNYLVDNGNWAVVLMSAEHLTAEVGEAIALGDNGEEGRYEIREVLRLDGNYFRETAQPMAVVLSDCEASGPSLF